MNTFGGPALCGHIATIGNVEMRCENHAAHPGPCWYNVPPLMEIDVDAYVRLLTRVAFLIERVGFDLDIAEMVGQEPEEENPPEDINLIEAEQEGQADGLRALASALSSSPLAPTQEGA